MAEIKYEVVQRVAVLSQRPRGWERQLGTGISLSPDELAILKGILEDMEL